MASVEITISGVLYDKTARTTQPVVLIGEASLTGVGVGGGPVYPPGQQPPGNPPGIWGGGNEPFPTPPIYFPPGGNRPPQQPPGIWPGPGPLPGVEHPIVLPEPPNRPPEPIQPPVSWKAVWHPSEGWIVVGLINPSVEHPVPS